MRIEHIRAASHRCGIVDERTDLRGDQNGIVYIQTPTEQVYAYTSGNPPYNNPNYGSDGLVTFGLRPKTT